ncbi:MAG TPA: hypothetical protein VFK34_03360 [Marmoricola sp.]|jgi:hypothetical protein|nr:hypothetical protein [Marmoricola sp.]
MEQTLRTTDTPYRLGFAVALGTSLLLLYGMAALGIIGAGGRPDLMYLGVLAVGIVGGAVSRLRAPGMAVTLVAMAAAQMMVAVIALIAGLQDEPGASVVEILWLNGAFAAMFLLSAWLFRRSAGELR